MPDTEEMEEAWDDERPCGRPAVLGALAVCAVCALCVIPGGTHCATPLVTAGAVAVVMTRLGALAGAVMALSRRWRIW